MLAGHKNNNNKKYVLWNAGICPIAEIVRNKRLMTTLKRTRGIIRCVVLTKLPWPIQQRKKRSV